MKQLLYYIGIFAGCLVVLTSCYEDKGNYEYHELEEVTIDTAGTGMLAEYAIMRYDSLRIAPNIYFEGALVSNESLAPLDYMWTIYSATTGVGANQVIDTIGYHSVLDTVITRTGGAYYVQLAVTNRHDGIRTNKEQNITITASSNLKEEDIEKAIKEAEAHAEEDRKTKEDIEIRNNADSLVYNTEKTLKDLGDKVSAEEKAKVEAELENVKKTLEGNDAEIWVFHEPQNYL